MRVCRASGEAAGGEAGSGAGSGAAGGAAGGGELAPELTYYDVGRYFSFNCTVARVGDAAYVWSVTSLLTIYSKL